MSKDELIEKAKNTFGLAVNHEEININNGYVIGFSLTPEHIRRIRSLQNHDWESFDIKVKMLIADSLRIPFGQIMGTYSCYNNTLFFTGSPEYMWGMIIQVFEGMNKS